MAPESARVAISQAALRESRDYFRDTVFSRSHPRGLFPCKPLRLYFSQWD
jgi:hypothetical protein